MSFGTITIGTKSFNNVGAGIYSRSTLAYGDPSDMIKISPGSRSKSGVTSATVSRHIEKDVTVSGVVSRRKMSVIVQIVAPGGFSSTEVDAALDELDTFVTATNINDILLGRS